MNRASIAFDNAFNGHLVDVAVGLALNAAMAQKLMLTMDAGRAALDLLSPLENGEAGETWTRHVKKAVSRLGVKLNSELLLLTEHGWTSLRDTYQVPNLSTCRFFTEELFRQHADVALLHPELERNRAKQFELLKEYFVGHGSLRIPAQKLEALTEEVTPDTLDFRDFPPSAFATLVALQSQKLASQREFLRNWFKYWKAKGKASTLAKYVSATLLAETGRQFFRNELLDDLLDTCIELEGASEGAFAVAVKAQIDNGGWFGFFESSEATEQRLMKVTQLFAHRADEFIAKSTKNWLTTAGNPSELIVPSEKLVFFLVKLGRVAEAKDLARSMVDAVIADTSALVLPQPGWA